jgi:signal transduction histidine kinase
MTHAVRDMLRIRKLEGENSVIRARLIEANNMLDEKNRRLDDFCATIAHDIRGPLSGLILKLDYIIDTYQAELDERFVGLLTRSLQSAERLVGVVQAMYEFAKVGSKSAKMELIDLNDVVAGVVADLPVDSSREVKIGVGELPVVWGNASLLRRVFFNLITNAIKYNDKEEVRINIGHDGEVARAVARYVRIFVEDNGPGIPAEEAAHVFDMFSRGQKPPGGHPEGLGIGLAVVQKIVELHFGRVELCGQSGPGCRFVFTLPRERVELVG